MSTKTVPITTKATEALVVDRNRLFFFVPRRRGRAAPTVEDDGVNVRPLPLVVDACVESAEGRCMIRKRRMTFAATTHADMIMIEAIFISL